MLLTTSGLRSSPAQAGATASRPSSISVFGEGGAVQLGYLPSSNTAFTVGADYTLHTRWQLDPSVELRATLAPGLAIGENSFNFGLRLERPVGNGRLVPFGTALAGLGFLSFAHPTTNPDGSLYRGDDSVVLQAGGGLRYRVSPRWSIQGEAQVQHWRLGRPPEQPFQPLLLGGGITYTLPFGPERRRQN